MGAGECYETGMQIFLFAAGNIFRGVYFFLYFLFPFFFCVMRVSTVFVVIAIITANRI